MRVRIAMRVVVGLLFLLALACGAAPKAAPPPTPALGSGPRVKLPSGAVYSLEVVRTPEAQAQGLMFRESLPSRHGMLFPFADRGVHPFWMKNTMSPLDIVWLDQDGKVLFVSERTPPCRSDPCPNYGPKLPAASVLEIAGGMAGKEGIKVGAVLHLLDVGP